MRAACAQRLCCVSTPRLTPRQCWQCRRAWRRGSRAPVRTRQSRAPALRRPRRHKPARNGAREWWRTRRLRVLSSPAQSRKGRRRTSKKAALGLNAAATSRVSAMMRRQKASAAAADGPPALSPPSARSAAPGSRPTHSKLSTARTRASSCEKKEASTDIVEQALSAGGEKPEPGSKVRAECAFARAPASSPLRRCAGWCGGASESEV